MLESCTDHEVLYESLELYKLGIQLKYQSIEDEDAEKRKYLKRIGDIQGSLQREVRSITVFSGQAYQIIGKDPVFFDHSEETLILGALKHASDHHPDELLQIYSLTMYEEYWESATQKAV